MALWEGGQEVGQEVLVDPLHPHDHVVKREQEVQRGIKIFVSMSNDSIFQVVLGEDLKDLATLKAGIPTLPHLQSLLPVHYVQEHQALAGEGADALLEVAEPLFLW